MMEIWLWLALVVMAFFSIERSFIWRKRVANLKEQLKGIPPRSGMELEIDLMIERMRLDGIEKLIANGRKLVYSHSVGICVRREQDECCVQLDEAILQDLCQKV